ncbi:MAG: PIG-L family deacetylase [Candidatus Omnitrophota bacterium]
MNKVLVLAVHPDDETLGCGGTILRHKMNGDKVYWLIATDMKKKKGFSRKKILQREREIKIATKKYGFDGIYKLGIPTIEVERWPINKVIKKISEILQQVKPNILYLPFMGDTHSDHRIISEAAWSSAKKFRCPFIKKILAMEIISETEFAPSLKEIAFIPNYFVDITDYLDKKIDIIKIFKTEINQHPFPRSLKNIKALAIFRGATAGYKYAESFMILKEAW